MPRYLLALDQGTTSSRADFCLTRRRTSSRSRRRNLQYYPQSGWVEHNPMEIYSSITGS